MTGSVLSEEEVEAIEGYANYYGGTEESDALLDAHYRNELNLVCTVRFHEGIKKVLWEQNAIFLEALERISEIPLTTRESAIAIGFNAALEDCQTIAREAIAKVAKNLRERTTENA